MAAARRIAKRVAAEETGEPEPPVPAVQSALRRVVGRCIYGVDINPMAAELARVSLWLEALEPGKPLSYLDQNIRVGNSLLGVTPALLEQGLPDAAFTPIEGDDRATSTALRRQNAVERTGQHDLFSPGGIPVSNAALAKQADADRADPARQSRRSPYSPATPGQPARCLRANSVSQKLLADAWCAAFVQPKAPDTRRYGHHPSHHRAARRNRPDSGTRRLPRHWSRTWPGSTASSTGTSSSRTSSASATARSPIHLPAGPAASPASSATRRGSESNSRNRNSSLRAIQKSRTQRTPPRARDLSPSLADSEQPADRALYAEFQAELRRASGWSHLLRDSGRYQETGQGDINTYAVFAETARTVIAGHGRAGLVLPTGIATDATTAPFFSDLVRTSTLVSFLEFENEAYLLSKDVHHSVRFCLLTVAGSSAAVSEASFAFGTRYMRDLPERRFTMPPEEILLVNPNTGTTPVFRSRRDAEITIGIYKQVPVLWREDPEENPWGLSFMTMYHMANDSGLFSTRHDLETEGWTLRGNIFSRDGKRMLPLYEAKMIHFFDHRYGTYEGQTEAQANMGTLPRLTAEQHDDADRVVLPRYWVPDFDTSDPQRSKPGRPSHHPGVKSRLRSRDWSRSWLLGWRETCRSTDERTVIAASIPIGAIGNKFLLALALQHAGCLLQANLSAFVFDYVARQKFAGTSLNYYLFKQLPTLVPSAYDEHLDWLDGTAADWITARVVELSYSAWDMEAFAREMGDDGPPFHWNDERRTMIRAELDAAYFHLYGLERDEVQHVMGTFDALQRREERQVGEFRTKRLILERYDAMAEAARTDRTYQTTLDPPPGHGPRHPARQPSET